MARVLVMSNDDTTTRFVRSVLEPVGHTVMVAPSVWEGLNCLRQERVELVFADLQMPECNDPHVIAKWREEFHRIKILALSDPRTVADFLTLRMMGTDDVLQMPVGLDELLHAVNEALHTEP